MKYTITIKQHSNNPARSFNGGEYEFVETCTFDGAEIISGEHRTSAEFNFCEFCGSFEQNIEDHIQRYHEDGKYQPSSYMEAMIGTMIGGV